MVKFELSSENQNFKKTCIHHLELDSFSILRDFSDKTGDDINVTS